MQSFNDERESALHNTEKGETMNVKACSQQNNIITGDYSHNSQHDSLIS